MTILIDIKWFLGIIFTFAEILGIISSIDAAIKSRTSQGAIAWVVSLLTFPYLAVPLYWIFGRNKFRGYVKLRDAKNREIRHFVERLAYRINTENMIPQPIGANALALIKLTGMPPTRYNKAKILINGHTTFSSIFHHINLAREYILIQFFIINDDETGRDLKNRLIEKAGRKVKIYLLYDEIGCHKLPPEYIDELKAKGIKASAFRTTKGITNRFQINFRNHRKIVVMDGDVAFVGGHNVGDEYMGKSKKFGPWRDTHVKVSGPSVQCLQYTFMEDWYWATGKILNLNWNPRIHTDEDMHTHVIASGPADQLDTCALLFLHMFNSAKKRVWIASPYFVPDPQTISALQLAALRGVDIRIILPEKPDHLLVYLASFSYYHETIPFGIKIYRYNAGFMHQKVVIIDDKAASVGTANLDNRSFRLNFEISLLFYDSKIIKEIEAMLEKDFANSREVSMEAFKKRPFWFKVAARFSRLFSPIL